MEKVIYQRVTPKYVIVYEPLNVEKIFKPRDGLKYRIPVLGCLYINRHTQKITKRHMSRIKRQDVARFLERNRPLEEMEEGADIVAKLLLRDGSML